MGKIPLYLVTGFLGSGKTTLLKRIIGKNAEKLRIGIIQNEFAPANVDGEDLKRTEKPFEILEINNGSIFCICLMSDFKSSLLSFVEEKNPDVVYIETSGLADPVSITEIIQEEKISGKINLAGIWCIIDALNFKKIYPRMNRAVHQVLVADNIFINKSDLVTTDEIQAVKKQLGSINPMADIKVTSWCKIDPEREKDIPSDARQINNVRGYPQYGIDQAEDIKSAVFRSGRAISLDDLHRIIDKYKQEIYRIKGYVKLDNHKTAIVQSVNGKLYIDRQDKLLGSTSLVLLGENFNLSTFSRDYRSLVN